MKYLQRVYLGQRMKEGVLERVNVELSRLLKID